MNTKKSLKVTLAALVLLLTLSLLAMTWASLTIQQNMQANPTIVTLGEMGDEIADLGNSTEERQCGTSLCNA